MRKSVLITFIDDYVDFLNYSEDDFLDVLEKDDIRGFCALTSTCDEVAVYVDLKGDLPNVSLGPYPELPVVPFESSCCL